MKKFLLPILILFLNPVTALSYEVNVHENITDYAISASTIGQYLNNNNLGISLNDSFNGNTAKKWMKLGSKWEDGDGIINEYIALRWLNHFYDPTSGKGLNPCPGTLCSLSLQWGKESSSNAWSWKWARDSYYKALTDSNPKYREVYFSYVFRALGQATHLVQDLASPAHVRNDPHGAPIIKYDMYEAFTRDNAKRLTYSGFPGVDKASFNAFDKFWINNGIGLAEYTNKNFFSRDTIFRSYPHPAKENTTATLVEQTAKDGKLDRVWYIQGYTSERLAAYSYFWKNGIPPSATWLYNLDDYVHENYASQLIPRAVGYSAGLLNYFFRGEIDVVRDTENDACKYIVYNLSNENMKGDFGLYYDDASGNRNSIPIGELTVNANDKSNPITLDPTEEEKKKSKYILVFKGTTSVKEGEKENVTETNAVVADAKVTPFTSSCGTELTIPGPDTISKNTTQIYELSGCTGCSTDVQWEVSGAGAEIETISNGIKLTTGETACGTITITAKCPSCGTEKSKTVAMEVNNCSPITIVNENGTSATDTVLRNGVLDFKTTGNCCEDIQWSVTAAAGSSLGGATISQAGVLTASGTSCGSLLVTATCAVCGTSETHAVRVANCGQWNPHSITNYPSGDDSWRWWGAFESYCDRISGDMKIRVWVILANPYYVQPFNVNYDPSKFTCTLGEYQGCDSTCYGRSYATPFAIYYERDEYGHSIWNPCNRSWEGGYCSYNLKKEIFKWEGI